MASRFERVVEEIRCKFDEVRARHGRGTLPISEDRRAWFVHRVEAGSFKQPPYISWVRVGGAVGPTSSMNPIGEPAEQVAPLYDAATTVIAIICGRDDEETEDLWFDVLLAAYEALVTDAQPRGFRWTTQEEDEAGRVLAGELVIQEFSWAFIVPREISHPVTIQSASHECALTDAEGNLPEE